MDFSYTIAGFIVGIMIGMTGVGGGSLMTPILIFFFSIQASVAVGTDLLFAAITKLGGVGAYWRQGLVNWTVVKRLAMGSITTSVLTLLLLKLTDVPEGYHSQLMTTTLGIALVLTSLALILKQKMGWVVQTKAMHKIADKLDTVRSNERYQLIATVMMGAVLGVMVTLSSVGAGALGAVALLFLYPKMKGIEIVATDIAHAVPLTAISGLGHASVGNVDGALLMYLVMGSLPGIYLGSRLGVKIPDKVMRPLLALLLFVIGFKCLLS